MTTTTERAIGTAAAVPTHRGGRWIEEWRPEEPEFWASTGKRVARRNLVFSVFSEHIGFSIWVLWSVFVLFLPGGLGSLALRPRSGGAKPARVSAEKPE